jgi:hypothetical protein
MATTTFRNDMRITGSLNVDGIISQDLPAAMAVGSGITGTGTIVKTSVTKQGGLIETRILIDLTGLNGGGTAADIIGGNGLANSHFGQITAAVNGTIFAGYMRCLEVPTGSNADVDLYSATEATGAEDAPVTDLTETILLNGGTWTLSLTSALTAYPAANSYLYLASGTATAATFTAGIFEIVLFGS